MNATLNLPRHARFALQEVAPLVERLIRTLDRVSTTVVILNPQIPYRAELGTKDCVLDAITYGSQEESEWPLNYRDLAYNKARICWRTRMSSRAVGERAPYLLESGDTKYAGGVICDSLVVATSGLPQEMDEAVSHAVIALFWASARQERDAAMTDGKVITL